MRHKELKALGFPLDIPKEKKRKKRNAYQEIMAEDGETSERELLLLNIQKTTAVHLNPVKLAVVLAREEPECIEQQVHCTCSEQE